MREPVRITIDEAVAGLDRFNDVLDTRSPSEFAEDHVPGAISTPVLDDEQRARIGTLHKQVGAFEANRLGAALVARNIGDHVEHRLQGRARDWAPLVYCWRGGQRSNAMATVLARVGWRVSVLEGGYRGYRRRVLADLETRPAQLRFVVVAGRTGSAKSRLLEAMARHDAQVLDLEAEACHRGSVLGDLPDAPQPSQKLFDSRIWNALRRFDPQRPVFVESESKKVGRLHVPDALIAAMRASSCVRIDVDARDRAAFLVDEYAHFVADPQRLFEQVDCIAPLHPTERITRWKALAQDGDWQGFVEAMLTEHYDPAYDRAMSRNFATLGDSPAFAPASLDPAGIDALAAELVARFA